MKVIDAGHSYQLDKYPAIEESPNPITDPAFLCFRKRIGDDYPGNEGEPHDGTSLQDVLRVLIDRSLYVDKQDSCIENIKNIADARAIIFRLERRAAWRRGQDYFRDWNTRWFSLQKENPTPIEQIPVCLICGHILCTKRHDHDRHST